MKIGIIGSGALGSNVARALAKQRHLGNNRQQVRACFLMAKLVAELGPTITAGTVGQAASADIVLVAVPWVALETLLSGLPAWNNRIVIDGTNPVLFLDPNSPEPRIPATRWPPMASRPSIWAVSIRAPCSVNWFPAHAW